MYEPDPTDITKFNRLSANEIETKLAGAIVEATFHIKHNAFGRGDDPHQSFSAILDQAIIWATEDDEPITTMFDNHDPNNGPMVLSPPRLKRTADNLTGANIGAGPSKIGVKARKVSDESSPPNTSLPPDRRRY